MTKGCCVNASLLAAVTLLRVIYLWGEGLVQSKHKSTDTGKHQEKLLKSTDALLGH